MTGGTRGRNTPLGMIARGFSREAFDDGFHVTSIVSNGCASPSALN